VVRVNDRGPFVANRIIDLSRSAAEKLGFIDDGIADVKIEAIDEEGRLTATTQQPSHKPATKHPAQGDDNSSMAKHNEKMDTPKTEKPEPKPHKPEAPAATTPANGDGDIELYELKVTRQQLRGFTVQIGSYKELVNLLRIADDLKSSLKKEVRVQVAQINGEKIYRLMVGEFNSKREAQVFKEKAAQLYPDCFIVELK
jgi:rare lipoprotein A